MKPEIIALANTTSALDAIRKGLIKCGFELEFQSVNGVREDDDPSAEINVENVEVGSDSSVSGGEARTIGALSPQEFMLAAQALFDGHDLEIDTGCSFHIHLSVPGVKHTYGKLLQAEMMSFILQNRTRLPESVRKRLKSDNIRYCKFQLDSDKMRAVHGHPQRTWEFRLFGNVSTKQDAWRCLLLAIDALRHAYQVRLRKAAPLAPRDEIDDFSSLAEKAIKGDRTLTAQIRYEKVVTKSRQTA